jgi:hypothetical protein
MHKNMNIAVLTLISLLTTFFGYEGHLLVEALLVVVILFQLTRKSYKPPKKPLTEKVGFLLCFLKV